MNFLENLLFTFYICSLDENYEINEKVQLLKDNIDIELSPEESSRSFSQRLSNGLGFSDEEYEEICSNHKIKIINVQNQGEVTYALIFCYKIEVSYEEAISNLVIAKEELSCEIKEIFKIWTIIDSFKSKLSNEELEKTEYLLLEHE